MQQCDATNLPVKGEGVCKFNSKLKFYKLLPYPIETANPVGVTGPAKRQKKSSCVIH